MVSIRKDREGYRREEGYEGIGKSYKYSLWLSGRGDAIIISAKPALQTDLSL